MPVKMLIKYDCTETFACLRESEVEEGRGVEGVKKKKAGDGAGLYLKATNEHPFLY